MATQHIDMGVACSLAVAMAGRAEYCITDALASLLYSTSQTEQR